MKTNLFLVAFCLLILSNTGLSQNTYKIFEPTPIALSSLNANNDIFTFNTSEFHLSCPVNTIPYAFITGPNGGTFVTDDIFLINNTNICPESNGDRICFDSTISDPRQYLGMPMEFSYIGVNPVNVSNVVSSSGRYVFEMKDGGYTYGNTEIYLTTSCELDQQQSQLCHRNYGKREGTTITPGAPSFDAHLAHGDTLGPCS